MGWGGVEQKKNKGFVPEPPACVCQHRASYVCMGVAWSALPQPAPEYLKYKNWWSSKLIIDTYLLLVVN